MVKAEFEEYSCAWKKADSSSQEEICSMLHNISKVCGFGSVPVQIHYSEIVLVYGLLFLSIHNVVNLATIQ